VKLTKLGHSCVRLEKDDHVLVIDPGIFSDPSTALQGAQAVLITHEHPDHIDVDVVRAAAQLNPDIRIHAPAAVAKSLEDLGDRVVTVAVDSEFEVAGFGVKTVGSQHAVIHPLIPYVANIGYLVDGELFHPGDSLTVPTDPVKYLLVPVHAPWSKVSEIIDFVIAVRADSAFPIHNALLNEIGTGMVENLIGGMGGRYGSVYKHLDVNEFTEL
jgi:L-ascorbate metabolism protein UlaG (beta-lactamase superfamily)